jgi:hypothetical protein
MGGGPGAVDPPDELIDRMIVGGLRRLRIDEAGHDRRGVSY